jgi:hypothetical protein
VSSEAVDDRHELVEQISFLLDAATATTIRLPCNPSRTLNQPNPTRDSRSLSSTTNVPHQSSFNKAVSFGSVSFTQETTSLITAPTDNPAAFENWVIRCA